MIDRLQIPADFGKQRVIIFDADTRGIFFGDMIAERRLSGDFPGKQDSGDNSLSIQTVLVRKEAKIDFWRNLDVARCQRNRPAGMGGDERCANCKAVNRGRLQRLFAPFERCEEQFNIRCGQFG